MNEPANQTPEPGVPAQEPVALGRFGRLYELEFQNLRWSLFLGPLLGRLLPDGRAVGLRTSLLRALGLQIGRQTRFLGMPQLQTSRIGSMRERLRIGDNCSFGTRVILEFADTLTIGSRVSLADGVVILTTTHELGPKEHRAGPAVRTPVSIGDDVTIEADAIILPGVTIGDGARVLANSVVNSKVAPGATVSGIPARPLRPTPPPAASTPAS